MTEHAHVQARGWDLVKCVLGLRGATTGRASGSSLSPLLGTVLSVRVTLPHAHTFKLAGTRVAERVRLATTIRYDPGYHRVHFACDHVTTSHDPKPAATRAAMRRSGWDPRRAQDTCCLLGLPGLLRSRCSWARRTEGRKIPWGIGLDFSERKHDHPLSVYM